MIIYQASSQGSTQMSSLKQNNDSQPFGQVYGDARHITNIFHRFIVVMIVSLVAGIFIVMSTNSVFAATVLALSLLPVLASVYFVRRAMFETAAAFLAIVMSTAITII